MSCQFNAIEFNPACAPRADRLVMVLVLLRDGRPHSTLRCADPHRILWWAFTPSPSMLFKRWNTFYCFDSVDVERFVPNSAQRHKKKAHELRYHSTAENCVLFLPLHA